MFEGFFLSKALESLEKAKVLRWDSWFGGAEMHHVQMIVNDCHLQVHELIIIQERTEGHQVFWYIFYNQCPFKPFGDDCEETSIAKPSATQ